MERLTPEVLANLFPTDFKAKAVILKAVELSYSKEDGLSMKGQIKKGPIKMTIDKSGNITVSGKVSRLSLNGSPKLKALGANFKKIEVTFSEKENGDIEYNGWVSVLGGNGKFGIEGSFDLEKLILDRGFLKSAYDPVKNRQKQLDEALGENK